MSAPRAGRPAQMGAPQFPVVQNPSDQELIALKNSLKSTSIEQAVSMSVEDRKAMRKENNKQWAKSALALAPKEEKVDPGNQTAAAQANFFSIQLLPNINLRRYRFEPGMINGKIPINREVRRELLEQMLATYQPDAKYFATDYFAHIISVGPLYSTCGDDEEESAIDLSHSRSARPEDLSQEPVHSRVVFERQLRISAIQQLVDNNSNSTEVLDLEIKSLNIITWKFINDRNWPGYRVSNVFYPSNGMPPGSQMNIMEERTIVFQLKTGFVTSVRPGDGSLLLNVNPTTSAFYGPVTLSSWIRARSGGSDIPLYVMRELRNLKVTFECEKEKKIRRVFGIDSRVIRDMKFKKKDPKTGTEKDITVLEHMNGQYPAYRGKFNPTALCVNLGGPSPSQLWYPADKLWICEGQIYRELIVKYARQMLQVAKREPVVNQNLIRSVALKELGIRPSVSFDGQRGVNEQESFYQAFGINISPDFVRLQTRITAQPDLRYGAAQPIKLTHPTKPASWNLNSITTSNPSAKPNPRARLGGFLSVPHEYPILYVVKINNSEYDRLIPSFLEMMMDELPRYGFATQKKVVVQIKLNSMDAALDRRARCAETMRKACNTLHGLGKALTGNPKEEKVPLIIMLLPTKDRDMYLDLKWCCDCLGGVATVFVTSDVINRAVGGRPDPMIVGNLALKINFKLGGTNHRLDQPSGVRANTIIFGADVTHSGAGLDSSCPSLASVVATCGEGPSSGHYLPAAMLQSNNTEFIENLQFMVLKHLKTYYGIQKNRLPDHILFYRDGVSESQYGMVKDEEIPQIIAACRQASQATNKPDWMPAITLLVVGKRHHTRVYPDPDSKNNLRAGTCIDHTIIAPESFNFYLQSHDSPLGTARAPHYVVITNGSKYTAKELQDLTNNLSFTGSRATKGLSICTPASYADILCERLRCYMKPVLNGELRNTADVPFKSTVDSYRQSKLVWGAIQGKDWPWHPSFNNRMFYL